MQKKNAFNKFYFSRTFFLIASYKILQNYKILINQESFFFSKKSRTLPSQFLEINSLMVETIKNQFSKTKFLETNY